MTVAPARKAAYEVLRRVFEDDAYADRALRSASEGLDERDRALARRLAYGAVQRVRTLDHAIETLGKRPVRKLDPPVRAALRLGAYQLGYLDGVPRYAAVNESVELVRRARLERAVPFTNAVLRRVGEGIRPLLDALPEGPLKHSYPDWIWEIWRRDLGEADALALMRAQNEPPPVVVRHVRGKPPDGAESDIPGAYRVERLDAEAFARGEVWPQSVGSQLAGLCVGSQDGERTLDLCAAPGGKATMLAGEVVAVEANEARAARARGERAPARRDERARRPRRRPRAPGRARRASTTRSSTHRAPASASSPRGPTCAGARSRCPSSSSSSCSPRRSASGPAARSSTRSARSTPTSPRRSSTRPGLRVEPIEEWPQFRHPRRPEFLQTYPHRHDTSGFFIARL